MNEHDARALIAARNTMVTSLRAKETREYAATFQAEAGRLREVMLANWRAGRAYGVKLTLLVQAGAGLLALLYFQFR